MKANGETERMIWAAAYASQLTDPTDDDYYLAAYRHADVVIDQFRADSRRRLADANASPPTVHTYRESAACPTCGRAQ